MKSRSQDHVFQTSCKNCVFAIYDGKTQTGCMNNRIEKLSVVEAYDLDKEFYVINGLCNYYRPASWNCGVPDTNKAKEESSITYDIIIDLTNIPHESFCKVEKFISTIEYDKKKYRIWFCINDNTSKDSKNNAMLLYKKYSGSFLTVYKDIDTYLVNIIFKSKHSYHIYINSESFVDPNILTAVNNSINDDMKKIVLAKNNGIYIVSNSGYKISCEYDKRFKYDYVVSKILETTQNTKLYIEL